MSRWVSFVRIEDLYVKTHHRVSPVGGLKPLVVVQVNRVLEACPKARAEGIRMGDHTRQVHCLCPQAEIVTFNPDVCQSVYRKIWDIVAAYSPVVEPADFHQGFADVTKVAADLHQAQKWQNEVSEQIQRETDLRSSIGMGPGKFVAQIAAAYTAVVAEKDVQEFLAPTPLSSVDWLDPERREVLQRLGLTTLGQVAAVNKNSLMQQVGRIGGQLHDWINGKDNRPVQPLYPPAEERVFHVFDIEDRQEIIIQALGELCAQLTSKLRGTASQARRLTLQVEDVAERHIYRQQYSRSLKDALRLYQTAERLFEQLWEGQPLLSIELVAGDLRPVDWCQLSLWASRRQGQIEQAMETVRSRYGMQAVSKASELADKRRFGQMILAAEGRFSW